MTLAAPRRTKEQGIFTLSDPVRGSQFEDQIAIHPGIELEVEVVQALVRIAELRLFVASLQEPLATAGQLIRDQRGDQVDGRHVLRLRLQKAGFHHCGHAAQAQLYQGTIEFDQVHGLGSSNWIRCWIRSRYWVSSRMSGSTCHRLRGACGLRSRWRRTKRYSGTPS